MKNANFGFIMTVGALLVAGCVTGQEQPAVASAAVVAVASDAVKPAVPAAGGTIVFASNRGAGAWRIWRIFPDGTGATQLLDNANTEEQDVDPVYSADGQTIFFASTRGGKVGIWRMKADGSKPERLCDGDQGEPSPDNKQLVLRKGNKLWVRDLGTGVEKQIVPDDFPICSFPVWSPDGRQVAFCCRWEPTANNTLWTVAAAGGAPVKVYDKKPASGPHWSPDGSRLVYETETHICTIKPDGTGNKMLTFYGGIQRFGRWSPDGQKIVYCQGVTEQGPWELYVMPSTGGTPTRLTEGGSDLNADWR